LFNIIYNGIYYRKRRLFACDIKEFIILESIVEGDNVVVNDAKKQSVAEEESDIRNDTKESTAEKESSAF